MDPTSKRQRNPSAFRIYWWLMFPPILPHFFVFQKRRQNTPSNGSTQLYMTNSEKGSIGGYIDGNWIVDGKVVKALGAGKTAYKL